MARVEYQAKTRQTMTKNELIARGAEPLSSGHSTDIYLRHPEWREVSLRIRVEGSKYTLATKGRDRGSIARVKEIDEREISYDEARRLRHEHGEIARIQFDYEMLKFGDAIISLDEVEILGCFLEVSSVDSEEKILETFDALGLDRGGLIKWSYLDMMLEEKLPEWESALIRSREKVSMLTFGIISGTITTLGLVVCEYFATGSKAAIAGGIFGALIDACSDAFGIYESRRSEGCGASMALRHALGTLAGKMGMPALFFVPMALCSVKTAVIINVSVGTTMIAVLNVAGALANRVPWTKQVATRLAISAFILAFSVGGGLLVHHMFG